MPAFKIDILSASLRQDFPAYGKTQSWSLSFRGKLGNEDILRTPSQEKIECDGFFASIVPATQENLDWLAQRFPSWAGEKRPVGMLTYHKAMENDFDSSGPHIGLQAVLPPESVSDLVAMVRQRLYPESVTIEIADDFGMKYGWEPDGEGKEWDVKVTPHLPVERISLSLIFELEKPPAASLPENPNLPLLVTISAWQRGIFWLLMMILIILSARLFRW